VTAALISMWLLALLVVVIAYTDDGDND